jgi:hypothetical protein
MKPSEVSYAVQDDAFAKVDNGITSAIAVWHDEGGLAYACLIRSELDAEAEATALQWFSQLLTRIEEHGLERAVLLDGWQVLPDGRYQLWGRQHYLPSLDA